MAVDRGSITPKCHICGEPVAKERHLNQSEIPLHQRIIGDTFQGWEDIDHKCKVYLIEASFGSFDSHRTEIIKVFKNKSDAVVYKKKYHEIADSISCTIHEYFMEADELEQGSPERLFKQRMWIKYHRRFGEYDQVKIIEKELN